MKDYLIVGQGIAGSLLALELQRRGCRLDVVDPGPSTSASQVAAGIYNPITGKRCVRTWGDTWLLPFAEEYYTRLERERSARVRFPRTILKVFRSAEERAAFEGHRRSDPVYASYVEAVLPEGARVEGLNLAHGAATVRGGGYVDIPGLMALCRSALYRDEALIEDRLAVSEVRVDDDGVTWKGRSYKTMVLCQGFRLGENPWFDQVAFRHAKGEILTLRVPGLSEDYIVNGSVFALPMGAELFRVGATYEWEDLDDVPTEQGLEEIRERFASFCSLPHEVVTHHAAVRPIARNRAPVAGRHAELPSVAIFGGFGSKGVLYAPYYAHRLAEHLEEGACLQEEVSLAKHLAS